MGFSSLSAEGAVKPTLSVIAAAEAEELGVLNHSLTKFIMFV